MIIVISSERNNKFTLLGLTSNFRHVWMRLLSYPYIFLAKGRYNAKMIAVAEQ